MKVQSISQFIFNRAEYLLGDESGTILLKIDYFNNSYAIELQTEIINKSLHQEAKQIARDLLARKHGRNFAEK